MHSFSHLTPVTFLERSGHVFPNRPAIIVNGREITFGNLLKRTRQLAELLLRLDINRGDRVGLLSTNSQQSIEAHFSIPGSGGVIVSINPWLPDKDIIEQLGFCDIKILVISSELFDRYKNIFYQKNSLKHIIVFGDHDGVTLNDTSLLDYEESIDGCGGTQPLDKLIESELDPIAINFTSGTTGFPKGVVITHRAAYLHALGQVMMLGLGGKSNYLWTLPMFHVNGWGHMWACSCVGAKQIVVPGLKVKEHEYIDFIRAQSVSHLAGAPRLVRALTDSGNDNDAFDGVTVVTGGAAPSPHLIAKLNNLGVNLIHQYGLNETCGPFVVCEEQDEWVQLSLESRINQRIRQGVPAIHAGTGLRVVDKNMNDVPCDGATLGEVVMAGNTIATEYFDNEGATKDAFRDGWFHSGDMAVMHEDGYLEIRDRIKDLIYVETDYGWENISSVEIENIISELAGVKDVAVIGLYEGDNENQGATLIAFLEIENGMQLDETDLRNHCVLELPEYKLPDHFIYMALPKTPTGKVRKDLLADEALRRAAAPILRYHHSGVKDQTMYKN